MYNKANPDDLVFSPTKKNLKFKFKFVYDVEVGYAKFVLGVSSDISNITTDNDLLSKWNTIPKSVLMRDNDGVRYVIINELMYNEGSDLVSVIFDKYIVNEQINLKSRLHDSEITYDERLPIICQKAIELVGKNKYLAILHRMDDLGYDVTAEIDFAENYNN